MSEKEYPVHAGWLSGRGEVKPMCLQRARKYKKMQTDNKVTTNRNEITCEQCKRDYLQIMKHVGRA